MAINAFQAGQLFDVTQAQQEQSLIERQRRERGINALAGMFGPGAQAPQAFATVTGAERAERKFQADEAQRRVLNERTEQIDAANAAQRQVLNDRAERIFSSDEKLRGIVADLNERKFGASQDHIAVLEDLSERKFISAEASLQIQQELARDQFISADSQRTVSNALNERKFVSRETQQDVVNRRVERGFAAGQTQQDIENLRSDRLFQADQTQQDLLNRRVERGFGVSEDQRKIENERQLREDDRKAQTFEEENKFQIATAAIGFLRAGQANKVPFAETVTRLTPALKQLGWTDEMIGDLPSQLANNPNLINELEGALAASRSSKQKRLISTLPVRNADGTTGFIQSFSDGSTRPVEGVTPLREEAGIRRVAATERRTELAAQKLDPDAAARLAAGKEGGKLTAQRVDEGLGEARDAVIAVENSDRSLELLDEGIRTGSIAEFRQEAARFYSDILGQSAEQIASTDEFFARSGIEVANQIKAFGSGTGLSDADREFAKAIVGGRIQLSQTAIRRLVKMRRDISLKTISNYNRDRDAFVKGIPRLGSTFPHISTPGTGAARPARTDIDDLLDRFAPVGGQ